MSSEDAESFDEEDCDKLYKELNLQFPDAPFCVDLFTKFKDICELDEPFTSEPFTKDSKETYFLDSIFLTEK